MNLDSGDKLFVYTDGIVEYQRPDNELYGTRRFCETLESLQAEPVPAIVKKTFESLMNFGQNAKPQDDITLLGLEIKTSVMKS